MKRQSGFTLIELVVVIVILGILAVTAAPRFLNLQSEARASTLQGMVGAMQGAASVVYAKSAMEGEESDALTVGSDVDGIDTAFGYPAASATGIVDAVTGLEDSTQWLYASDTVTSGNPAALLVTLAEQVDSASETNIENSGCYITYTTAADASTPATAVITDDSGC
ncbi:prepilin-type N-terminal cleavage/methylation domain-containing protein [Vibrio sp. JC009]|uniref:prepilin-type N-terminal cleavage/methylation domain-containing protein n=1 Tax=Vibrio sp. JC009 TaxID=2912314 RepID=UPI0023AFDC05|nr:prepilin-type N-terminal cleavage/methylation domain-containing protein [Vibrio sp. JC009]WED21543.1 prepilin-type N-terminal cleavage/methylation domain-containing protein [Vibrio sp. JC009]